MTRGQLIEVTTPDGVAEAYVTGPATQERPVPGVLFDRTLRENVTTEEAPTC